MPLHDLSVLAYERHACVHAPTGSPSVVVVSQHSGYVLHTPVVHELQSDGIAVVVVNGSRQYVLVSKSTS